MAVNAYDILHIVRAKVKAGIGSCGKYTDDINSDNYSLMN